MDPDVQVSNRGFTLLELALTVALSAVLLTAFFSTSYALMQGLLAAANGMRGPSQASDALDRMITDLEQATSFSVRSDYAIEFQTPGGKIGYRMYANDRASQDIILERALNDASQSIGPRHMFANFNPLGATYVQSNNVPTTGPVKLFGYNTPSVTTTPVVDIYLVMQPSQTAPVSYMRTKAWCVTMLGSW